MENHSTETLFDNVVLKQSKTGYRYSIDPILVSHFAQPLAGDRVVDLGTGCGIIPIIMAYKSPSLEIIGVEIQSALAELANENIILNNMTENIKIYQSDMKKMADFVEPGSVDMIITNPPYTKKNSGRINPDSERAVARHEIKITLAELVKTAAELLKNNGKFVMIFPVKRQLEAFEALKSNGINPKLLRLVHTKKNSISKLFLLNAEKNGSGELVIAPPLYVFDKPKNICNDIDRMFK